MGTIRSHNEANKTGPSTFALLVDDISKLTESEQKLLRLQLNLERVSALAKKLDASVVPHNLSGDEIDALITEARKNGKHKKD